MRQWLQPGGPYVDDQNDAEYLIPGAGYLDGTGGTRHKQRIAPIAQRRYHRRHGRIYGWLIFLTPWWISA